MVKNWLDELKALGYFHFKICIRYGHVQAYKK